jgi:hypothetical protein
MEAEPTRLTRFGRLTFIPFRICAISGPTSRAGRMSRTGSRRSAALSYFAKPGDSIPMSNAEFPPCA